MTFYNELMKVCERAFTLAALTACLGAAGALIRPSVRDGGLLIKPQDYLYQIPLESFAANAIGGLLVGAIDQNSQRHVHALLLLIKYPELYANPVIVERVLSLMARITLAAAASSMIFNYAVNSDTPVERNELIGGLMLMTVTLTKILFARPPVARLQQGAAGVGNGQRAIPAVNLNLNINPLHER